jgi:hypothetical protein
VRAGGEAVTDAMARRLFADKVIRLGVDWLRVILAENGVDRVSLLPRAALLAAIEERDPPAVS